MPYFMRKDPLVTQDKEDKEEREEDYSHDIDLPNISQEYIVDTCILDLQWSVIVLS